MNKKDIIIYFSVSIERFAQHGKKMLELKIFFGNFVVFLMSLMVILYRFKLVN